MTEVRTRKSGLTNLARQLGVPVETFKKTCEAAKSRGEGIPVLELLDKGAETCESAYWLKLGDNIYAPTEFAESPEFLDGSVVITAQVPVFYCKRGEIAEGSTEV